MKLAVGRGERWPGREPCQSISGNRPASTQFIIGYSYLLSKSLPSPAWERGRGGQVHVLVHMCQAVSDQPEGLTLTSASRNSRYSPFAFVQIAWWQALFLPSQSGWQWSFPSRSLIRLSWFPADFFYQIAAVLSSDWSSYTSISRLEYSCMRRSLQQVANIFCFIPALVSARIPMDMSVN
jgi:hypothetical protein